MQSFTQEPDDIAAYAPLTDETGERVFALRVVGRHKDQLIARIDGVDDRTAAEALGKVGLYVPRAVLPATGEDEFYYADLIGLAAELTDGTALGTVRAVHDFGAGDVVELRTPEGADLMVPFTRAVVPVVDLAGRRIVIAPPPGLLDGGGAGT